MGGRGATSRGGRGGSNANGGTPRTKSEIGIRRDKLIAQCKQSVPSKFKMRIKDESGHKKLVTVYVQGKDYKHLANDVMDKKAIQESKIRKLGVQLKNSYYKKTSVCYKPREDKIDRFYYLKTKNRKLYFNVARYKHTRKNGKAYYTYRLHAITRNCR